MKIAMVSEHASPLAAIGGADAGGQNVHVAALAEGLAHRGHQVVVYTRRDDPALPDRVEMVPGVLVEHVEAGPPEPIPKDEIFPHLAALSAGLRRRWSDERPDVVHSHFWMSGIAALRAARPAAIPVLHTYHALGTVKRRHQGSLDTSPAARIPAEAWIAAAADRIIATCADELFELVRMGADPRKVSIVPCGVDPVLFHPLGPAHPRVAQPARVVSVGRLVERKGVDDLIRALPEVPGCELVVAGGGPWEELDGDPDAGRLRALARDAGVGDRVRLIGRVARTEVPALLRSADVVACTPWYEPFGIVPLEAMACGVPVVATAVGGLTDTVLDGVTGVHVPPRRPAALAPVLRRLLADEGARRAMGKAGRRRAVERYQWNKVVRATAAVYEGTLRPASDTGRRGRGHPTRGTVVFG